MKRKSLCKGVAGLGQQVPGCIRKRVQVVVVAGIKEVEEVDNRVVIDEAAFHDNHDHAMLDAASLLCSTLEDAHEEAMRLTERLERRVAGEG